MFRGERISRDDELSSWKVLHHSILYRSDLTIKSDPSNTKRGYTFGYPCVGPCKP